MIGPKLETGRVEIKGQGHWGVEGVGEDTAGTVGHGFHGRYEGERSGAWVNVVMGGGGDRASVSVYRGRNRRKEL